MVCIPCFIIPAVLFIWYRFLQPIFLRIWNPFGKVEAAKSDTKDDKSSSNQTVKEKPNSQTETLEKDINIKKED